MTTKASGRCPKCQAPLSVDPGQTIKCPGCRTRVNGPRPAPRSRPRSSAAGGRYGTVRVKDRTQSGKMEVPIRNAYFFDDLVKQGLMPPPPAEVREALRRNGQHVRNHYPIGPGEVVRRVAKLFGIPFCTGCQRRYIWLNRLGWSRLALILGGIGAAAWWGSTLI